MDPLRNRVGAVVADVADRGAALFAAVWPRSMARWEVERLTADGYPAGEVCDVDFSLAFDDGLADVALPAVRHAGFVVGDIGPSSPPPPAAVLADRAPSTEPEGRVA